MLTLQNDRLLTISTAGSRKATYWPSQTLWWSEMVERLRIAVRGTETLAEYLKLPKSQQDDLKDIGGFVGGTLTGNRRKAAAVTGRDIVTLDLDNIPAGGTADALRRLDALGCAYVTYSTRKHHEAAPRLRVLIPTDRTVTADEYQPIARRLADIIGIEWCDPSTFEVHRLMYWPSCCADSQYVYDYRDRPFVSADGILAMYADWRNVDEWPEVPGAKQARAKLGAKQGDPTEKQGVVGAFCRIYDVHKAIETFLSGVYESVDTNYPPARYTYTGGSTTAGAIVYDDGRFLYSHHATDPVSGRLVNAFDLVRIHKFGELDDDAAPGTPTAKLPSYTEMKRLALQDERVVALLDQERYERVQEVFGADTGGSTTGASAADDGTNWLRLLDRNPNTGMPEKSARNVQIVLEHDPALRGRIYLDSFADRIMGIAPLPWGRRREQSGPFVWDDYDDDGLCVYLEALLKMSNTNTVRMALRDHAAKHARNPVAEYLTSLEWDGVPRLDTLYIDYLGAEDCQFVRTVTRKAFVAAVARAMTDSGVKFDNMTVICGPQRIGKSTLFRKLGRQWFSDSIKSFEGKEAEELVQGRWIVEIAELQGFNKVDVNRIKQFLSKIDDQYRAAYGRHVKVQLRRCVFFGTTNDHEYLRDPTGNRRFWPVDAMIQQPTKSVFNDLSETEVDQIWAEAVMRWRLGEPVYLSDEMEDEANRRRESHMESDPLRGQIEEFIERLIPENWLSWDFGRRMMFWNGQMQTSNTKLVPRDRVCALEIWRECLGERRTMTKADAKRINDALQQIPGWTRAEPMKFGADYGRQRGFRRAVGVASISSDARGSGVVLPLRATFENAGNTTS